MYQVDNAAEALKICAKNKSPSYKRLETYQSWVDCTQYDGRPSWWSDRVPQWERRPCIVYPTVRKAIESNVDLMLGERPFPEFSLPAEKGKRRSPLDEPLKDLVKFSRFKTLSREAFGTAQGVGTSCAVFGVRNGRVFGELIPAKWCEPEFTLSGEFEVKKLVIQYPYIDEEKQTDGTWRAVCKMYRREITDTRDIVFKPHKLTDDTVKINWVEDPARTVDHGLGFCPVVWYPFMKGCQAVNVIHGNPIQKGITDEIQGHDISRSQWHKVALYSEPQVVEIGVSPEHNPTGTGRIADVPATEMGGAINPGGNPQRGAYTPGGYASPGGGARKKGMGVVWRYTDPTSKVEYLTVPESAIKALEGNTLELRMQIQDSLGVVFLDQNNIKFASVTSGKALQAIKQKQLDRIDQYRPDFRDGFIIPALAMMLRIAQKATGDIKVPGFERLRSINVDSLEYDLEVRWGDYQDPEPEEQQQIVDLAIKAREGGLIDNRTAIKKIQDSDVFEIESVEDTANAAGADAKSLLEGIEVLSDINVASETMKVEALMRYASAIFPDDEAKMSKMRSELESSEVTCGAEHATVDDVDREDEGDDGTDSERG